jgi:hypothetical protein
MSPKPPNVKSEFEIVHTMTAYYDGARGGIANHHGRPHVCESLFEDAPDGTDVFLLQPIDDETFRLAMEDWAIWCRWERAFHSRQTTQDTHPALPENRARHQELEAICSQGCTSRRMEDFVPEGELGRKRGESELTSSTELVVYWVSHENVA